MPSRRKNQHPFHRPSIYRRSGLADCPASWGREEQRRERQGGQMEAEPGKQPTYPEFGEARTSEFLRAQMDATLYKQGSSLTGAILLVPWRREATTGHWNLGHALGQLLARETALTIKKATTAALSKYRDVHPPPMPCASSLSPVQAGAGEGLGAGPQWAEGKGRIPQTPSLISSALRWFKLFEMDCFQTGFFSGSLWRVHSGKGQEREMQGAWLMAMAGGN